MTFIEKLHSAVRSYKSVLCVGLDPDPDRIPDLIKNRNTEITEAIVDFCSMVIRSTSKFSIAYKPNLAFFEAHGSKGIEAFERVLDLIPSDKISIADAKRGDIGNTASRYSQAFLERWKCDSVTLSPLMGFETIVPYINEDSNAVFVLTLTSNPGAEDFFLQPFRGFDTMSEYIADSLASLDGSHPGHVGMVVGATRPDSISNIAKYHPQATLLIPGVGSQGGDIEKLIKSLADHRGVPIVNVSRGIMYGENDADLDEHTLSLAISSRAESYFKLLQPLSHKYY